MKYIPKSEEELEKEKQEAINASLLANGEYDFEVITTSDKPSNSGAEMITLKLNVFDHEGNSRTIFDYLTEAMGWKIRHAADACGLLATYESGSLAASSFDFCTGKVKIKTQKGNKEYPNPKNVVEDYIKRDLSNQSAEMPNVPTQTIAATLNGDDIPF